MGDLALCRNGRTTGRSQAVAAPVKCRRRLLVLGLVVGLLVVGCGRGGQSGTQESQGGQASTPPSEASYPEVREAEIQDYLGPTFGVVSGGEYVVGTTLFKFRARVGPASDDWIRQHLTVESTSEAEDCSHGSNLVVEFGLGEPGEVITLTVSGVAPVGEPFVVKITRVEEPSVLLEVCDGGLWRPILPGEYLSQLPLDIRLSFTREVDRTRFGRLAEVVGASATWVDPKTVIFSFKDPAALSCGLSDKFLGYDIYGLPVHWPLRRFFYAGPLPQLWVYDPSLDEERLICGVATRRAEISPDGKRLLWFTDTGVGGLLHVDAMPAATAEEALAPELVWAEWIDDERLLCHRSGASASSVLHLSSGDERVLPQAVFGLAHRISPDRRLVAVVVSHWVPAVAQPSVTGYDLSVIDLTSGGILASSPGFLIVNVGVEEWNYGPEAIGLCWSADGTTVLAPSRQGDAVVIKAFDLTTGLPRRLTASLSGPRSSLAFSGSPDGRFWVLGRQRIAASPPYDSQQVPGQVAGVAEWSPDGTWLAYGWRSIDILEVEGMTARKALGRIVPCGWDESGRFYFIRWKGLSELDHLDDIAG